MAPALGRPSLAGMGGRLRPPCPVHLARSFSMPAPGSGRAPSSGWMGQGSNVSAFPLAWRCGRWTAAWRPPSPTATPAGLRLCGLRSLPPRWRSPRRGTGAWAPTRWAPGAASPSSASCTASGAGGWWCGTALSASKPWCWSWKPAPAPHRVRRQPAAVGSQELWQLEATLQLETTNPRLPYEPLITELCWTPEPGITHRLQRAYGPHGLPLPPLAALA